MKFNDEHFFSGTVIIYFGDKPYQEINLNAILLCKLGKMLSHLHISRFNFVMKLKDVNYKSHWNILAFFDQWKMMSGLNMSHGKINLFFVSFPLFRFTSVIKLRNFDFESHYLILNTFW